MKNILVKLKKLFKKQENDSIIKTFFPTENFLKVKRLIDEIQEEDFNFRKKKELQHQMGDRIIKLSKLTPSEYIISKLDDIIKHENNIENDVMTKRKEQFKFLNSRILELEKEIDNYKKQELSENTL